MQIERIARGALAGIALTSIVTSTVRVQAACGDGALDGRELCDDGNMVMGDGCNALCQTEAGYVCSGSTGAPSLCCFKEAGAAYSLQGNASFNMTTGEVTLVPDVDKQVGVAWFRQTLDFSRPFSINLRLYLGTRDSNPLSNVPDDGADGGAVLFQRDPRGLSAIGEFGGELGAQGISPVVGVEFDTYNNAALYNDVTMGDEDHVSVFHTATTPARNHLTPAPVCMNEAAVCTNFEDGKYHAFRVEWTGTTGANANHLIVRVDEKVRVDVVNDLVANYFAGNPAGIYFGFAASTGDSRNLHKFCPAAPEGYTIPRDNDTDGMDDRTDNDDDNDGHLDAEETSNVFGTNDPSDDHDRDGVPNYQDVDYWRDIAMRPADCPDADTSGACDHYPATVDFDRDDVPDHLDTDSDGDEVLDSTDPARTNPCVPNAASARCVAQDTDNDGLSDRAECPDVNACPDSNGDGTADFQDPDQDDDGVKDGADPEPRNPCVPDAMIPACTTGDADNDGLTNGAECPSPTMCVDTNADGTPDYLDPDQDDDGAKDGADPAPRDPCIPVMIPACTTGDADRDGLSNATECPNPAMCVDTDGDGTADYLEPDQDGDAVLDGADPERNNPCVPNMLLLVCSTGDADADGLTNGTECPTPPTCFDTDGDGAPDYQDADRDDDGSRDNLDPQPSNPCVPSTNAPSCGIGDPDGDGLPNSYECAGGRSCRDTDQDAVPDYNDPDADGDGVGDRDECATAASCAASDIDGDGVPDVTDPDQPEIAGGSCSLAGARTASDPGASCLLAFALASLLGRRMRHRARASRRRAHDATRP